MAYATTIQQTIISISIFKISHAHELLQIDILVLVSDLQATNPKH
jgi:hypothetical protein